MRDKLRTVFGIIIAAVVLYGGFPVLTGSPALAAEGDGELQLQGLEQIEKGNPKLDSQLNKKVSEFSVPRTFTMTSENESASDSVRVIVESVPGQTGNAAAASARYGTVELVYGDMVQVSVPVSQLSALAKEPDVRLVRMPQLPLESVTSEGVSLIGADTWQDAGYTGAGVKVGILDGGFAGYLSRQGEGELPVPAGTWWAPGVGGEGSSAHGTACAEIVYDIAPAAQFYFANFSTVVEMGNAVTWLISQGVDVITCSVGWPVGGPGNGTGPVCDIVNTAYAAGVLWVQSAGNSAQRHWQGDFYDPDFDFAHNYTADDETNNIYANAGETIVVGLRWNDPWGASSNDYDLGLYDKDLNFIIASVNTQDGNDDPVEFLAYTAAISGTYHIVIVKYNASSVRNFDLYSYNHDILQYKTPSSSIAVPADAANALAVGAVDYRTPSAIEPFSSQGPTRDGRIKPDIVAPDGVSTVSLGAGAFYGTSASAPHAAGAAVLAQDRYDAYSNTQLRDYLEDNASDLGTGGKDNVFGSGKCFLNTDIFNKLTVQVVGEGTTSPTEGTHLYLPGTSVNITATPASGWGFLQWEGDVADNTSANTSLLMSANRTITAHFISHTTVEWQKTYGGSSWDSAQSICRNPDGDFVVLGTTYSYGAGGRDFWLFKTNDNGTQLWMKTYGGSESDYGRAIEATADGGYILVGNTRSYGAGYNDVWLIKVNSSGNMIWNKVFGGIFQDMGYSVAQTNDGGYIVCGSTRPDGGLAQIWLIKTDASGNKQWDSTLGPGNGHEVVQTADGGYVVAGTDNDYTGVLLKADSSGNLVWSRSYGGYQYDSLDSVKVAPDGGLIVIGTTQNDSDYAGDVWLIKTDMDGNEQWDRKFALPNSNDTGYSVLPAIGGGYIITGYSFSYSDENKDLWIIRTNETGNLVWDYLNDVSGDDFGLDICQSPDGAITIAGENSSDGWIIRKADQALGFSVYTSGSNGISSSGVTLNGMLSSFGQYTSASVSFEYGTVIGALDQETPAQVLNLTGPFSAILTGLSPNTTYYFRAKAVANPTVYGQELSFTTLEQLDSIAVTPANPAIPAGGTRQFTATAHYSDNSTADITATVTWTSSNTTVATVSASGLASGHVSGISVISATLGDVSGNTTLTVTKSLHSITIGPANHAIPVGSTQQFTATGTFTDTTTADISGMVTWTSSNVSVATVTAGGLVTALAEGVTTIAAASGNVSGSTTFTVTKRLDSITVTPAHPSVAAGRVQQFTATGHYSDTSTADITTEVAWTSSAESVAVMNGLGMAFSSAPGTTTISATRYGVSGNTTLTVTEKVLDALAVTPSTATVAAGTTQQFTATGTYSDNSTAVLSANATWSSSNTTVATVNSSGLVQALAEGTSIISGSYGGYSANATLTVTVKEVASLSISPLVSSIPNGRTQQFTAIATYTDASTANVTGAATWSSSNTTVARIYSTGLAQSLTQGTTVISASFGGKSANTTLDIAPAVLDYVQLIPGEDITVVQQSTTPVRLDYPLLLVAVYSDKSTFLINVFSEITSSNTSVVQVQNVSGLVDYYNPGVATITATFSGKSDSIVFTVLPDTVVPLVHVTSPVDGQLFGSAEITVTGTTDDTAATRYLVINGGAPVDIGSGASFSVNATLNVGSNTILVKAIDGFGNVGTSGTITVEYRPGKPAVAITQPAPGTVTNVPVRTVTGTVSGNVSSATLILNGVSRTIPVTGGSFSADVTLTSGRNVLLVNAYEGGHEGDSTYMGTSGVRVIELDVTPPVVMLDEPLNGALFSTDQTFISGTVDDPFVTQVTVIFNGNSVTGVVSEGRFQQYRTLVDGTNTVIVTATDAAGNTGTSGTVTIVKDTARPVVTITSPVNGLRTRSADVTVTGTVNDPTITSAILKLNGANQTIAVSGGTFSRSVTLASGENTIEVTATDGASNTGNSGVIRVYLDTVAPVLRLGLNDPTDSITITVTSNEALVAAPTLTVDGTGIAMIKDGTNRWSGTYGSSSSPIVSGNHTATVTGTDKAGNTTTRSATFCKQTVTVTDNSTATVSTSTTTLQISATANLTDASVSVTQHTENPSGNVGTPSGANMTAGAFIEIVASPELRDNLAGIYVTVNYDPAELPAGTDEATLKLYLWDLATGTWQVVPGSGANTTSHYIYGTLTHLSKYGGFGTAIVPFGGGGGFTGGGGGGSLSSDTVSMAYFVDNMSLAMSDFFVRSVDEQCRLDISQGTKCLNGEGSRLESIYMREAADVPVLPEGTEMVGCSYDIGPDGAQFDPAIRLSLCYDPSALSENVTEEDLYLAWWDGTVWVALEGSTVDIVAGTVSANTTHFTRFAILGAYPVEEPEPYVPTIVTAPAEFSVSNLVITPEKLEPDGTVKITAVVTNTGGSQGIYDVILLVNGIEADRTAVSLLAGSSKTVSFTVTGGREGVYSVMIGNEEGRFTVAVAALPEPETANEPETEYIIDNMHEQFEESESHGINWWLVGGVIAGFCIVVLGVTFFIMWKKEMIV